MDLGQPSRGQLEQPQDRLHPRLRSASPRMATVGKARRGEPGGVAKDIPPTGLIEEHEPRVYFGELQGQRPDQYSTWRPAARRPSSSIRLVGVKARSGRPTPTPARVESTIGSHVAADSLAAKFADINILLSDRVNSQSKIIYDRTAGELRAGLPHRGSRLMAIPIRPSSKAESSQ